LAIPSDSSDESTEPIVSAGVIVSSADRAACSSALGVKVFRNLSKNGRDFASVGIRRVVPPTQICAGRFQEANNVLDNHDHVVRGSTTAAHDRLRFFKNQNSVRLKPALSVNRSVLEARTGLNGRPGRQGGGVQKDLDAIIALDESKTFVLVEELDFSGWHSLSL
jgi:hypothetical protein